MKPDGKTDSAVLDKFRLQSFNIKCTIYFGLVWNEMQSSLSTKTDTHSNQDDGTPVYTSKLAQDWIAANCS